MATVLDNCFGPKLDASRQLGDLLVRKGLITPDELSQALGDPARQIDPRVARRACPPTKCGPASRPSSKDPGRHPPARNPNRTDS